MSEEQQHKAGKEQRGDTFFPTSSSSANASTRMTTTVDEMRNQEFVARLMAATPPYLYSAPMGPNNFFFSDMLRSLITARNQKNARNLQLQQTTALAKRCKKRTWSQYRTYFKENDILTDKSQMSCINPAKGQNTLANEKPLELTNHKPHISNTINKTSTIYTDSKEDSKNKKGNASNTNIIDGGAVDSFIRDTPSAASLPTQDLVLPPPPPVWYPSLYPPYGIDPLHFFIDLRVSGQVWDRKKENRSPLSISGGCKNSVTNESNSVLTINDTTTSKPIAPLFNKHGLGSAFSVPQPRSLDFKTVTSSENTTTTNNNAEPNNLDINNPSNPPTVNKSNKFENYAKYHDFGNIIENRQCASKCSANHMLQQLPRLYAQFTTRDVMVEDNTAVNNNKNPDLQNKSEADCDIDSDEPNSIDNYAEKNDDCYVINDNIDSNKNNSNYDRDIDVEYVDTVKYHRSDNDNGGHRNNPIQRSIT